MKSFLFAIIFLAASCYCLFAQETLTITTYYPSPYGSYNELHSNKLAVGDTNNDGAITPTDQPPANGQLYVARSVILKPRDSTTLNSNRVTGELIYDTSLSPAGLSIFNGSTWVPQAGGAGGCYTSYTGTCDTAAGFNLETTLGTWGTCAYNTATSNDVRINYHRPPGGACADGGPTNLGTAVVCCRN